MFNIKVEKWKWNKEYELYVSNMGHFKTRDKKDCSILVKSNGYCSVYAHGTVHNNVACHRAVMLTWRPTINAENLTVDHLDHNKRNNALSNLEWVSQEENLRRAYADLIDTSDNSEMSQIQQLLKLKHYKWKHDDGIQIGKLKFTSDQFIEICKCLPQNTVEVSLPSWIEKINKKKTNVAGFNIQYIPADKM